VFETFSAWRTPDGSVQVSPMREEIMARMPKGDYVQDNSMHEAEHSVEALVYWLHHARPDLQIVPVIVPAAGFDRLQELATHFGEAIAAAMKPLGWKLGADVAVVISADAVHYGEDFKHVPFGASGAEAHNKAVERDQTILTTISAKITPPQVQGLYETFVDPANPDSYRVTWCGRFSIPMGMLALRAASLAMGARSPRGISVGYATSIDHPALPLRDTGLGVTAPATDAHFVGYPAVAFESD
jgi:MEMO1 family protein